MKLAVSTTSILRIRSSIFAAQFGQFKSFNNNVSSMISPLIIVKASILYYKLIYCLFLILIRHILFHILLYMFLNIIHQIFFIYMNICSYVYITSKEIKCQYKIIFNIYQILFTLVLTIFTLYQISFYQEFMCYISWQLMFRFNGVIHLRHLLICNRMI